MKIELSDIQRENIKEIRKRKGITADVISEKLGKSKGWFTHIERGRTAKIELEDLKSLAKELDTSVVNMIGYVPGEFLIKPEIFNDKKEESYISKVLDENADLRKENTNLKKENAILKERLRQISNICNL